MLSIVEVTLHEKGLSTNKSFIVQEVGMEGNRGWFFNVHVCLAINKLCSDPSGKGAYGAEIKRFLSVHLQRKISPGAVYSTIQRLRDSGYVKLARLPLPKKPAKRKPGDRERFYCKLTDKGIYMLRGFLTIIHDPLWNEFSEQHAV